MSVYYALAQHFTFHRNWLFDEVEISSKPLLKANSWGGSYLARCLYRADLLVITPNHYATEVEVKDSLSDWKADLSKEKWVFGLPDWITRFYYAVPESLGMPDWVPEFAGVLHISGTRVRIVRAPKTLCRQKVPEKVMARMLDRTYIRYWYDRQARFRDAARRYGEGRARGQ